MNRRSPRSAMADRLWSFCIERYGRDGVSAICLELQDRSEADICLLLFCLWHGEHGSALGGEQLAGVIEGDIGSWHRQVVRPLRSARKAMKQPPASLGSIGVERDRARIKALEMTAERRELRLLAEFSAPHGDDAAARDTAARRQCADANLKAYLRLLSVADDARVTALAASLVEICVS